MSDILIGVIVLVVVFGGALFGMFLRGVLPNQHLSTDARDVIRIVMAMLATLSAVVLGLLTGSAINSLSEKETELRNAAVQFILLDRTLAAYGPETNDARKLLKQLLTDRMSLIWPEKGGSVSLAVLGGGAGIDLVQQELFAISPQTEKQRWLRSNAPVPLAIFDYRGVLVGDHLCQLRPVCAAQCQRDRSFVHCCARTCGRALV